MSEYASQEDIAKDMKISKLETELAEYKEGLEYLLAAMKCERKYGVCVMVHSYPSDGTREACNPQNCRNVKADCPAIVKKLI